MGEEAGRVDGRPANLASLDQVTNLGTDSVPDIVELGAKDSMDRLDRDTGVSADGLGKGCSDTVIVGLPLVLVGGVPGDNGGIAGEGEGGLIR